MWEDFRHGLLFGSQEFVDRIKKKRVLREKNSEKLFLEAASFLGVDLRDLGMAMKRSAAYSGWDFPLGIYGYPR